MYKLYVIGLGDSRLFAVKAIRDALKVLASDTPNALKAAVAIADECDKYGYAFIGQSGIELPVQDALAALTHNDYAAGIINPDEAELASYQKEPEPSPATTELSTVESAPAYAAAMVMLSMTNGNPLKAFAHAHSLASVSNVPEHYQEIMATLLLTFPWILEMAKIGGIEIDWKEDEHFS